MNFIIGIVYILIFVSFSGLTFAQGEKIDSSYNNWYYQQRMDLYTRLRVQKYDVVFLGNSITEKGYWQELLPGKMVADRGIGGDNTFGVLARLDNIISLKPKRIIILIGINDLGRGLPQPVIMKNYYRIVTQLKKALPKTELLLESVLPMNEKRLQYDYLKGKNDQVIDLNVKIRKLAAELRVTYIDLHPFFCDQNGNLKIDWTLDGIHLTHVAYVYWVNFLKEKKYL